ncbi:50S ribosomal protein L4 [[Eubacterium] cellulosolvens]
MRTTAKVYDLEGKSKGKISLPEVFDGEIRLDLIKRAVLALQSHRLQPQGRNTMAGKRTTAESYGVGHGLARVPRVKGERYQRSGQAAFAPSTVKGRVTHAPTINKILHKKINKKERLKALQSAIAATVNTDYVSKRGHLYDDKRVFPIVVVDEIQTIRKTHEAKKTLQNLGVWTDVEKVMEQVKIRAGKGRRRGRGRKHGVGPLIVINDDQGLTKAAKNFLGVNVINVKNLNPEDLAPGTHPGRLTVWTESAIKILKEKFSGA